MLAEEGGGDEGARREVFEDDGEGEQGLEAVVFVGGEVEADDAVGCGELGGNFAEGVGLFAAEHADLGGVGGDGRGRRTRGRGRGAGEDDGGGTAVECIGAGWHGDGWGAVALELADDLGLCEGAEFLRVAEDGGAGVVDDGEDERGVAGGVGAYGQGRLNAAGLVGFGCGDGVGGGCGDAGFGGDEVGGVDEGHVEVEFFERLHCG